MSAWNSGVGGHSTCQLGVGVKVWTHTHFYPAYLDFQIVDSERFRGACFSSTCIGISIGCVIGTDFPICRLFYSIFSYHWKINNPLSASKHQFGAEQWRLLNSTGAKRTVHSKREVRSQDFDSGPLEPAVAGDT